ncbi:MAG: hypothetical protein HY096_06375 [Nitrospinae bacterium]|nr:hypothetical protein [Nitrospinota bacterium]
MKKFHKRLLILFEIIANIHILLSWLLFRVKYLSKQNNTSVNVSSPKTTDDLSEKKENLIQSVLSDSGNKSFLEIGIGMNPNIERVQLLLKNHIRYTACDFEFVCKNHSSVIRNHFPEENLTQIRFLGNKAGNYNWTLFELLKNKESFDLIYLDGSHTFYTDLPAFMLAHLLLKPCGILMIDDLEWTLNILKRNMAKSFFEYKFYRKMYNFAEYDEEQQATPHIKLIVDELFLKHLCYSPLEKYKHRSIDWVALKKSEL